MGLPVQRERSDVESGTPEPFSPEMLADPYPAYRALRERGRIQRTAAGHWLVLGYDEVSQLLTDQRFGQAAGGVGRIRLSRTTREGPPRLLGRVDAMLSVATREHRRLRRLVSKAFTPRSVQKMRPLIQQIVNELLEGLAERADFDLVWDLAWPLPVIVIAEMLGIPREDRERFKRWSDAMVATLGGDYSSLDEARRSNEELVDYVSRVIADRRKQPRDDLISRLVAAEESGQRMSDDEMLGTVALLLVAGNETTTHLISSGMLVLLRNPAQMARLREDPSLFPSAIDEMLRYTGPVHTTRRTAREDVSLGDARIRRGDVVVGILAAANRDPNKYEDPDRFDVARNPTDHVAFGDGIHFCLGAALARLEGQIAIGTLLRRVPNLQLRDDQPEWAGTSAILGVTSERLRQ